MCLFSEPMEPWQMDLGGMDTPPLKVEPAEDAGDAGSGGSLNLELLREFARRLQTRQPDTSAGAGDRPESPEPDQALRGPFVPPREGECDLRMVWSPHRSTRWRRATEPSLVPYPEWAQTLELNRARALTSSAHGAGPDPSSRPGNCRQDATLESQFATRV